MRVLIDKLGQKFVLRIKFIGSTVCYRAYLDVSNDEKHIGTVMLPQPTNKPMRLWVHVAWRNRGIMEQLLAHLHQDHPWDKSGEFVPNNELGQLMVDKYWQTPPSVRVK